MAGQACAETSFPFCAMARMVDSASRKMSARTSSCGKFRGELDGEDGHLPGELPAGAQRLAEVVELLVADGDGEQVAFVFPLPDDVEAAGQFLAAIGQRLLELEYHHAAEFGAVGRGQPHALHQNGADRQREADGGALRHGLGHLLHGAGNGRGADVGIAPDVPAAGGGHNGDESRSLAGS